ncbi:hypothetical protein NP493_281g00043 [Ridgeia piscesae]|uniref:Uncharacterized protein n=1 Tax=Ridgeia piscesae TaxID=27915 RepID=A0AAD9UCC8_RIDPI|nr:hypothetical protein NP493_281g00043 [Ridgeia piscesae]
MAACRVDMKSLQHSVFFALASDMLDIAVTLAALVISPSCTMSSCSSLRLEIMHWAILTTEQKSCDDLSYALCNFVHSNLILVYPQWDFSGKKLTAEM